MKKIILVTSLFLYVFTSYGKSTKHFLKNTIQSKDPFITIIFKARTFKKDTVYGSPSENGAKPMKLFKADAGLYYSKMGSFIQYDIPKKNYKKSDTLKIYTTKDIVLTHNYYYSYYSLYRFKPGDIVEFDYPNEYPVCKILNRKLSDTDLNCMAKLNLEREHIDGASEFFVKNKRHRNSEENALLKDKYIKQFSLIEKKIDSLQKLKLINIETYELFRRDFVNRINNENINKGNLLMQDIDLSLNTERQLVLYSFNTLYKPLMIKNTNGSSMVDAKAQFENVINEKNITTKNKDFLFYSFMVEIITKFSRDDIDNYFEKFKINVADKELIKFINDKYHLNVTTAILSSSAIVMSENKELFELSELIKTKYKNKVVYIDFWASWCAPCRAAMPGSKKLQEMYKDKDVVFVFISIDNDSEKWVIASKKENLSFNVNNFLGKNYPIDSLYKELQINTIPRYLLFDKKGNLVDEKASGPDNDIIISDINKYLRE